MKVLARMPEPIRDCEDGHHADDCRRVIWEVSVTSIPDQHGRHLLMLVPVIGMTVGNS
jgi:hypothetical protein